MQKCVKTTSGSGLQNLAPFRKLGMVLVSKSAPLEEIGDGTGLQSCTCLEIGDGAFIDH
jgi:hypothetical protein